MTSATAAELIATPRGRALCLQLARQCDPGVQEALFWAVVARREPSASFTFFAAGEGQAPTDPPARPAPLGDVELAALVAAIPDAAIAAQLEESAAMDALEVTVDAAMYWQAPNDEEQLAARPALRDALRRVAEAVVRSRAFAAWAEPAADAQWRVDFYPDGGVGGEGPAGSGPEVLDRWRAEIRAEEAAARRDRPADPEANWSGSWWSIPPGGVPATTGADGEVPHGLRLVEDRLGWTSATATPMRGAGGILELSAATWVRLCREHPLEVTASRRHDWYRATGRAGRWVIPDWAAVAEEWDAVHLSIAQYLLLAGRVLEVADGAASLVAGWDPDRTVWLAGSVRSSGEPQRWTSDDAGMAGAPWRRVDAGGDDA